MNGEDSEAHLVRSAATAEADAANRLVRRRDWRNWSEADQTELEIWLAESPAHEVAYIRLEALMDRTERLRALKPVEQPRRAKLAPLFRIAIGLAAITVVGFAAIQFLSRPDYSSYQTAVGDRETLSLGEGSQIELNTDTMLRLSRHGERRSAWLDQGEAYFQIKHDAAHPFVVVAGDNRITDLGTKFVVRRFANELQVTLLEGRTRLDATRADRSVSTAELKPGDVATVRNGTISIKSRTGQQLADNIGWRRGILMFRNVTLAEAVSELNRYNRTQVVISDPSVARLRIYGAFAANDVAAFADASQAYFNLRVKANDGRIAISR